MSAHYTAGSDGLDEHGALSNGVLVSPHQILPENVKYSGKLVYIQESEKSDYVCTYSYFNYFQIQIFRLV